MKKKIFRLKAKIALTVILPIFLVVLSIKVVHTFIRIKVRGIFAKPQNEKPVQEAAPKKPATPVPASMTKVEKEVIKPEPVGTGI